MMLKISDATKAITVIEYFKDYIDEIFYTQHEATFNEWANSFQTPKKKSDFDVRFFKCSDISDRSVKKWRSWYQGKLLSNGSVDHGKINKNNRKKFEDFFNIKHEFWIAHFTGIDDIRNNLKTYINNIQEETDTLKKHNKLETFLHKPIEYKLSLAEEQILEDLKQQKKIGDVNLSEKSPHFIFLLSKLLKSKDQAKKAIDTLQFLNTMDTNYKRKKENYLKIHKILAECYSHKDINEWDKAIDILLHLYELYGDEEPEIMTLLGANHKRKALSNQKTGEWYDIDNVDYNLLYYSVRMYEKAMLLKNNEQYYEAINILYYDKILEKLESKIFTEDEEVDEILNQTTFQKALKILQNYEFDTTNPWEAFTYAEYKIFEGYPDVAISIFNDFFEQGNTHSFDISTTIRQMEMYTHFTDDKNFKKVVEYLKSVLNDVIDM